MRRKYFLTAALVVAGIAIGTIAARPRPRMVTASAVGHNIVFPDVKDKAEYQSPIAGRLVVNARADLPPALWDHDLYWVLYVHSEAPHALIGETHYDHQAFHHAKAQAMHPTFKEVLEMPAGEYMVTVGLIDANNPTIDLGGGRTLPNSEGSDSFNEVVR